MLLSSPFKKGWTRKTFTKWSLSSLRRPTVNSYGGTVLWEDTSKRGTTVLLAWNEGALLTISTETREHWINCIKISAIVKDFVQSNFYPFSFHSLFRSMLICQTAYLTGLIITSQWIKDWNQTLTEIALHHFNILLFNSDRSNEGWKKCKSYYIWFPL